MRQRNSSQHLSKNLTKKCLTNYAQYDSLPRDVRLFEHDGRDLRDDLLVPFHNRHFVTACSLPVEQ
jgi:hypothetical protein